MLFTSLFVSCVLFLITGAVVWGERRDKKKAYLKCCAWAVASMPVAGFCLGFFISPSYLLHATLLTVAALTCWSMNAGASTFTSLSAVVFIASYLIFGVPVAVRIHKAQQTNPFESLTERVAFSNQGDGGKRPAINSDEIRQDTRDLHDEMRQFDMPRHSIWRTPREDVLQLLHERSTELFISSQGFGVGRMRSTRIEDADLPESPPLPMPQASGNGFGPPLSAGAESDALLSSEPLARFSGKAFDPLNDFHRSSVLDFLDPIRWGYVKDRDHVTGFRSHQFSRYPRLEQRNSASGHWRVETLELVSLLKHDQPAVYMSRHLPRMDRLGGAATRPLDDFEKHALTELRKSDDLIAATGENQVRMLGAIRARPACAKCHDAESGTLLGAFSYDLRRDQPR